MNTTFTLEPMPAPIKERKYSSGQVYSFTISGTPFRPQDIDEFQHEYIAKAEQWAQDNQHIINNPKLITNEYINKNWKDLDFSWISQHIKLSEDMIHGYKNQLDWAKLSQYQNLSEYIIIKYANKVNWFNISQYQKLSKVFIIEWNEKLDFLGLRNNKHIDKETAKELHIEDMMEYHYQMAKINKTKIKKEYI